MKKIFVLALAAMMALSMTACSGNDAGSSSTADESNAPVAAAELKFGQVQYAAHGTKSFAVTSVVMDGDKIAIAYIDEFQVLPVDATTPVPNAEVMFADMGDGTKLLGSKKVNNEYYSNNMTNKAQATNTYVANIEAIEAFAEGKTVAELEAAVSGKEAAEVVELVAGSTMVDTQGYLLSIIEAAKAAK